MAEWRWASVVSRPSVHNRSQAQGAGGTPSACLEMPATPSAQANARNDLSTCPPRKESGQVDRLVPASEDWDATDPNDGIERDAEIPRAWSEGFARLDPDRPPADVPPRRWQQFIEDVGRFLDSSFAKKATALGLEAFDIFGCDRDRPFARIDQQGLCWLIAGNRLVDLSAKTGVIETWTGARETWLRKPSEPGRVLAWELADGEPR
jgi:hypothetical protein